MSKKINYRKSPKSFKEQIELLEKRGLNFKNKAKAEKILENISYNRLSAYWYPLLKEPKDEELFKSGSNFEKVFRIYQFDSELRIIMFYAIEQIEIALRTQIIFHLSNKYNSGFWFRNPDAFKSYPLFVDLLKKLCINTQNSNQEYIKKYSRKYNQYIPPSWKSFETLSFNTLFSILKNLKDKNEQVIIAKHFGLHHDVLKSWVNTIIYIRNICAHHSRLWNNVLTISPVWPKTPYNHWVSTWENKNQETNDKELNLYSAICITEYLIKQVNPYNKFRSKLDVLFDAYPDINKFDLGYPDNWKSEPLWAK